MQLARPVWTLAGLALMGTGLLGLVVPGLPTTIFLILALACFKKGSARLEAWMLNHPLFGAQLQDWEDNRWMTLRAKWLAGGSIVVFGTASLFVIRSPWAQAAVAVVAAYGLFFVLDVRLKPAAARGASTSAEPSPAVR